MLEQLQFYIIPIAICICFLFFIYYGKITPMRSVMKYFVAGTLVVLAVIVLEIAENFFTEPDYTHVTGYRWVISIAAYILRPGIAFIMFLIPFRNKQKSPKVSWLVAMPFVINAFCLLISPVCGIVYTFNDKNEFIGGPFRYLPFVVGFAYLVCFVVWFSLASRNGHGVEWGVFIPIIIMIGLAVYLESECNLLGSLPLASIIGMIFYYIYFYMDYYIKDSITGAYQRGKFYQDIMRNGFRYFIIFDVNGLRRINNELGHLYGDNALESFGKSVLSVLPNKAVFYRIGGDEFAIIYRQAKEEDINLLIEKIEGRLDTKVVPYGVSFGFSSFEKAEDFNAAYKRADKMLYKNKAEFWQANQQ